MRELLSTLMYAFLHYRGRGLPVDIGWHLYKIDTSFALLSGVDRLPGEGVGSVLGLDVPVPVLL